MKKNTWKNLKQSWKYAKGSRRYLVLFLILGIIQAIGYAIVPLLTANLIIQITEKNVDGLIMTGVWIALVNAFYWLCNALSSVVSNKFSTEILIKLQSILAEETLYLSQKELNNNSSGVFADRINNDCGKIGSTFVEISFTCTSVLANAGILLAVFLVSKIVFGYYIIVIICLYICNLFRYDYFFKFDKKIREVKEKNTGTVTELIRGLTDIKVLNAISGFTNKMKDRFKTTNTMYYKLNNRNTIMYVSIEYVKIVAELLFIIIGVVLIKGNLLTFASFIILFNYQDRVYALVDNLNFMTEYFKDFELSAERIFEIISHHKFEREKFGKTKLEKASGNFEFKNVHFGYDDKEILKGISFKIKENETLAFVGKSGSGKTTIFNLLTKLYEVDKGEITIDNININDLTRDSIRGNMSLISQNPYIFNFTIRENLRLVKEDMTDEEMVEVCKLAQIHDYIMTLPDKYDTLVGEGGINLSGGQRQRLAIARALLRKTEIILFDEATSALDNQTQRDIQKAINNMKGEYTILIIAHRLSTVINSDRIILIDDGKVKAEGTHTELMKTSKDYKELYETEMETK